MKPIGIIIITYNRPHDLLDLLKSITNLSATNTFLEDVIIFNNASTISYTMVEDYVAETKKIPFKYIVSNKNLGVSGGRNAAVKLSNAPLLFFIDDDTVFATANALQNIVNIFSQHLQQNNPLGIVTIQIKYYDTNEQQITAFPHKNYGKYKSMDKFYTSYYAGCAHIIKKEVFEKIDYLREDFFYGMEEYDYSYRAIEAGFSLVYNNSVTILHKESPLGRKPKNEVLQMMWVNKSKVAYCHLPIKYFYSTSLLWSLFYLQKSRFNIVGFLKGWKQIFTIPKTEKRKVISKKAKLYLKTTEARLYY